MPATYLRHAPRHVQETLINHVAAWLRTTRWLDPVSPLVAPFGTTPVVLQTHRMDEAEMRSVTGNMVAISFADEPEDEELELGGGIVMIPHVMFIDIIGVNDVIALALASDIKDLLTGRAPNCSRYLNVLDYRVATPVVIAGYRMELADVVRTQPDNVDYRRTWQIVKATAELTYPADTPAPPPPEPPP